VVFSGVAQFAPLHPLSPDRRPPVPAPRWSIARPLAAGALLLGLVLALAACGGASSPSSSSTAGQQQQRRRGGGFAVARDPKVQACLKAQGVALPAFGGRRGRPPGTGTTTVPQRPPTGTNARPPAGRVPRDPAQFAKLRAALAKCGVQLPQRGPGGPPGAPGAPGPAPTGTTAS
jgi:hypothetical protein